MTIHRRSKRTAVPRATGMACRCVARAAAMAFLAACGEGGGEAEDANDTAHGDASDEGLDAATETDPDGSGEGDAIPEGGVPDGDDGDEGNADGGEEATGEDWGAVEPCAPRPEVGLGSLRVTVDGRRVRDALGREVWLRGVNAGGRSKFAPFLPFPFAESEPPPARTAPPFDEALRAYVAPVAERWGMNVVRVPFSWEALEPERGEFDEQYLDRVRAMAQAWSDAGVRVVIDFHQDVFHARFCGDGFPAWAVAPGEWETPAECASWFAGYLSHPGVRASFDRFWANEDGLLDAFVEMWAHVAEALWPVDGVIGFEPINEPSPGTMEAGAWARDVIAPLYVRVGGEIRSVAPGALVFVDAQGAEAISARTVMVRPELEGIVFAPHFYQASSLFFGEWGGAGDAGAPLAGWAAVGEAWSVPVLLGEFGIRPEVRNAALYMTDHFDALDRLGMHGTIWEYSWSEREWNDEGMTVATVEGEDRETVDAFVRVYPWAVAGEIRSWSWEGESGIGVLEWGADAGGVTELAVPAGSGAGRVLAESPEAGLCAEWDAEAGRLLVRSDVGGPSRLRVRVEP